MIKLSFRAFGISHLFHPAPSQHLNHLGQLPTSHLGQFVCISKAIKEYKRVKIQDLFTLDPSRLLGLSGLVLTDLFYLTQF